MKISKKISEKKNSKYERIIDAASRLFSEKNFHEVMMGDVALRASTAKGTLYNYFKSKEDLYFSIMLIRMEKLISSLKEKISNESDSVDSLHSFIIHNYMFLMKYQSFSQMYQKDNLNASNSICNNLRKKDSELRKILMDILACGKSAKQFRYFNEEFAADIILGSIFSAVNRGIKSNFNKEKLSFERGYLFDFIIKGLMIDKIENSQIKNVLITKSVEDCRYSFKKLTEAGMNIIYFPTIEIQPTNNWDQFDNIVRGFSELDYLIFTSGNTVEGFIKRCTELNLEFPFDKTKVAVVGKKTASVCKKYAIPVNLIPDTFSSKGLIELFSEIPVSNKIFFIPGSSIAKDEFPEFLKSKGAIVKTADIYDVSLPSKDAIKKNLAKLNYAQPDLYVFTSPSSFNNFIKIINISEPEKYFKSNEIAAIGPSTKEEIEKKNLRVTILPEENSLNGLADSILKFYS